MDQELQSCQASAYLWETQRTPHVYLHLELFQLTTEVKKSSEILKSKAEASLETQGQIVGARESLNGPKNMARRKKKRTATRAPGDNVLPEKFLGTMSYQTSSKRSPPFCLLIGQKNTNVFWHQSEVRTASTVWNWSGKTLSPGALLAVLYFSSCHIFPPV